MSDEIDTKLAVKAADPDPPSLPRRVLTYSLLEGGDCARVTSREGGRHDKIAKRWRIGRELMRHYAERSGP